MKVLVLSAHPDDEMAAAATIHKLVREGNNVSLVVFTGCEDSVPEGWAQDSIVKECDRATKRLGLEHLVIKTFPNKNLEAHRQEVLDLLYAQKDHVDLVLTHSSLNSNQDHITVYNESRRAFRQTSILGYLTPSSDYGQPSVPVYSVVEEEDVRAAEEAMNEYKSQFELKRPYFDKEFLRATMIVSGREVWKPFAEKFENVRVIMN